MCFCKLDGSSCLCPNQWAVKFRGVANFIVLCTDTCTTKERKVCQVRIQDLVKEGAQLLRPKVADVAKRSHASEASNLRPGKLLGF